jgi:DNA-binding response OmpR family regulator
MEQVLIIDSDPIHAADLKEALEAAEYRVSVHRDHQTAIGVVKAQLVNTVVVVPRSPAWWRSDLKLLCNALSGSERMPTILCLLRWPSKGPDDRLYGDQLSVKVLHEG